MGLSASAISRVVGVDISYKSFAANGAQQLPQRLAVFGQGNDGLSFSLDKYEGEGSAASVAEKYGYGSPLHLAALQLYPETGNIASFPVDFFPVATPSDATAASGSIGLTGTATEAGSGSVVIGGKKASFAVSKGDTAATVLAAIKDAIDGVLEMPVTTGDVADGAVALTAKWAGVSGNGILLSVDCDIAGLTFSTSAMAGGAKNPSTELSAAMKKAAGVWYTAFLNTWNADDSDILDLFFAEGEARWGVQVKMPVYAIVGTNADYATRTTISDGRKEDYINAFAVSVGSPELPLSIAARWAFYALETFDADPARDVKSSLSGLLAGSDEAQENYTVRNNSISKGSSTNLKSGSVAVMNDFVTFYHPTSAGKYPSKRYVVDISKLQNVCYNVRLIMESDDIKGAELLTDSTVTKNPNAVQPKTIKTMFYNLADSLALLAIIQNPDYTKKNLTVEIDSENPKRLNTTFPVQLSGNVEVSSNDIYFAFYTA